MNSRTYRAVFAGQTLPSHTIDEVLLSLAESQINIQPIQMAIAHGHHVIVGENLNIAEATSLQRVFEAAGAILRLEDSTAGLPSSPRPAASKTPASIPMYSKPNLAASRPVGKSKAIHSQALRQNKMLLVVLFAVSIVLVFGFILIWKRKSSTREAGSVVPMSSVQAKILPPKPKRSIGRFDPQKLYIMGRTESTPCSPDVVIAPDKPDEPAFGFPCGARDFVVRPRDGRLLYLNRQDGTVRQFEPDDFFWDADNKRWRYPSNPQANDPIVVKSGICPSGELSRLFVGPSDELIMECMPENELTYVNQKGKLVNTNYRYLKAIGEQGVMLTMGDTRSFHDAPPGRASSGYFVLDRNGNETHVRDIGEGVFAVRNYNHGFGLLKYKTQFQLNKFNVVELWYVDLFGDAGIEGEYPDIGSQFVFVTEKGLQRIDGEGNLYTFSEVRERIESRNWGGIFVRQLNGSFVRKIYNENEVRDLCFQNGSQHFIVSISSPESLTGP